jgi:hypothetical protein
MVFLEKKIDWLNAKDPRRRTICQVSCHHHDHDRVCPTALQAVTGPGRLDGTLELTVTVTSDGYRDGQ